VSATLFEDSSAGSVYSANVLQPATPDRTRPRLAELKLVPSTIQEMTPSL